MKRAIATIAVDEQAQKWAQVTRPFLEHYAARVGAEIIDGQLHDHPEIVEAPPEWPNNQTPGNRFAEIQLSKLDIMREALEQFDRVLWLDADLMVRPDSPDLFDIVPPDHWAGLEEIAVMLRLNWFSNYEKILAHMAVVCQQEGLPEISRNRAIYFNCGVQLAGKSHAFLYAPAKNPDNFGWAEQTRVSVRLNHFQPPIYYLPECFNCMKWAGSTDYMRTCYFNHYCGLRNHERLTVMTMDANVWSARYGCPRLCAG
jgi:hypothetical protein